MKGFFCKLVYMYGSSFFKLIQTLNIMTINELISERKDLLFASFWSIDKDQIEKLADLISSEEFSEFCHKNLRTVSFKYLSFKRKSRKDLNITPLLGVNKRANKHRVAATKTIIGPVGRESGRPSSVGNNSESITER